MFGGCMIVCETPWIMLKLPVGGTSYGHAEWNSLFPGFVCAGAVVGAPAAVVGAPAAVVGLVPAFGVSVALLLPQAARAAPAAAPAITARNRRRVTAIGR